MMTHLIQDNTAVLLPKIIFSVSFMHTHIAALMLDSSYKESYFGDLQNKESPLTINTEALLNKTYNNKLEQHLVTQRPVVTF